MKKFFYACLGILCLTLAFHFGATSAQGQSTGYFRVIGPGFVVSGESVYRLTRDGFATWTNLPPVNPSQLEYFYPDVGLAIATDGRGWVGGGPWTYVGQIPMGATSTLQRSFGQVKTQFR